MKLRPKGRNEFCYLPSPSRGGAGGGMGCADSVSAPTDSPIPLLTSPLKGEEQVITRQTPPAASRTASPPQAQRHSAAPVPSTSDPASACRTGCRSGSSNTSAQPCFRGSG